MAKGTVRVFLWAFLLVMTVDFSSRHVSGTDATPAPPQEASRIVEGQTAFALDLYRQLRVGEGNLIFSPLNISSNLTMVYAGADGPNAAEMETVLHLPTDLADLHPRTGKLLLALNSRKDVTLRVASALWLQKGYPFLAAALDQVKKDYAAETFVVDFQGGREAARQAMNAWGAKNTNDRIKESVPSDFLDRLTRLVASSVVYFKGEWVTRLDPKATKDAPFHLAAGGDVQTPMMFAKGEKFRWAGTEELDALEMPYKGNELSMVVILPKKPDGLPALEDKLKPENLSLLFDSLHNVHMRLYMPKFSLRQAARLDGPLKALGMVRAFELRSANFPKFTAEPLRLEVIHSAFIDLDEKGTEAGAITSTGGFGCSAPAVPLEFRVDRPFLFLIRDVKTGSILFMGRVVNPKE